MEKLQLFLLIVQIITAILMIGIVLIQKSDGDSLGGIGGGSNLGSVISSKASASILTKITMSLVALFMLNCLILAVISSKINKSNNMEIDKVIQNDQDINPNHKDKNQSPALPPVEN